jgi:ceramide glucosyltransferase
MTPSGIDPLWLWLLGSWTLAALGWWCCAAILVARSGPERTPQADSATVRDERSITVFKPLASPLSDAELCGICACLESFAADLDANTELLIGAQPPEQQALEEFISTLQARYPHARLKLIVEQIEEDGLHPKIAWNRSLAAYASGELWFWSDADIQIEPGTFASLRADMAGHEGVLTTPYVVSDVGRSADLLDALFINVEMYPGVELLSRLDGVPGTFGAGALFSAALFRSRTDWTTVGAHIAEDYLLGRLLAPVKLARTRVTTKPMTHGWKDSLLHYLRWQKTIRWCQPLSYAAQVVIVPLLGWLVWLALQPDNPLAWSGFFLVMLVESFAGWWLCRSAGCRIRGVFLLVLPCWSLLRALTWAACWLPWPVIWRNRRWWSPRLDKDAAAVLVAEAARSE